MELAKELFTDVLHDRIQCGGNNAAPNGKELKLNSALADADRFLADGVPIAVHVFMGHSNCKAHEKELCAATQKLEVWTFKIQRGMAANEAACQPMILPLFLRQAIRSQLHFSPFRSWLKAHNDGKLPDGLCPLLRVSTSAHFVTLPNQVHTHQFPPCRIDSVLNNAKGAASTRNGPCWLQIQVQWLKKEYFLATPPMCPEIRMEQDGLWTMPPNNSSPSRCCSRGTEKEEGDVDDYCTSSEDEEYSDDTPFCTTPTGSLPPVARRNKTDIEHGNSSNKTMEKEGERNGRMMPIVDGIIKAAKNENEKSAFNEEQPRIDGRRGAAKRWMRTDSKSGMAKTQNLQTNRTTTPHFHPRTALPLSSSPAPPPHFWHRSDGLAGSEKFISSRRKCQSEEELEEQKKSATTDSINRASPEAQPSHDNPIGTGKWRCSAPSRLVCNFEESMLSGRIAPNSIVEGFRLHLTVIDATDSLTSVHSFPIFKRLSLPVMTYFFNDLTCATNSFPTAGTPSPLHMARCELDPPGISIPKRCTLQVVLFNPYGSIVKLFMVEVDVCDMPPNSRTFIRQRTYSGGDNSEATGIQNDKQIKRNSYITGSNKTYNNSVPNGKPATSLRFLIHIRLASNGFARVYLHSDIRILFSNKASDLEGLESIIDKERINTIDGASNGSLQLKSTVEMPQLPKYSPIK